MVTVGSTPVTAPSAQQGNALAASNSQQQGSLEETFKGFNLNKAQLSEDQMKDLEKANYKVIKMNLEKQLYNLYSVLKNTSNEQHNMDFKDSILNKIDALKQDIALLNLLT